MATGLVYDDRYLQHVGSVNHPERPDRLRAIVARLKQDGLWERFTYIDAKPIDDKWMLRCHDAAYLDRLRTACERGDDTIDTPDCPICPETFEIAKLSAGGVLAAADAIADGTVTNAFCAVRPPGHHAERDRAMGFCFLGNVAIAADYFIEQHGHARVAVVDFDVHHGNGTQHIHERRSDILFISIHEHPKYLYPGTGYAHETGKGDGEGFTLNVPVDPHSTDDVYRDVFESKVLPRLRAFDPRVLIVSAGFDAAEADPLAHVDLTPAGFRWMTEQLQAIANEHCDGRLLSCLEGGYDLDSLADCAAAHVEVLLGADG